MNSTSPIIPSTKNATRLFGYDIFISFALGLPPRGTRSYASDLARRLRELDVTVFFSEDEATLGGELHGTIVKALRGSYALVVIANRNMLEDPRWVRTEVQEFRRYHPKNPVIPISVDEALKDGSLSAEVNKWLAHQSNIWVEESKSAVEAGLASDDVVKKVAHASRGKRANRRYKTLAGITFFLLVTLAIGFGFFALRARTQLATNFWSQAILAKKSEDGLRATHLFAKAIKEYDAVRPFIPPFPFLGESRSEIGSRLDMSMLNMQMHTQEVTLTHVVQHEGRVGGAQLADQHGLIVTWSSDGSLRILRSTNLSTSETTLSHKGIGGASLSFDGK